MLTISVITNRNIFDSQCQTIVNTVNCDGVMALETTNRYPDMFEKYRSFCEQKLIDIGKLWLYKEPGKKWILNFPTKTHWKYNSEYDYIEQGMAKFVETYQEKNIESIAFPILGCDGELNSDTVLEIMLKYLSKCDNLIVEIYK